MTTLQTSMTYTDSYGEISNFSNYLYQFSEIDTTFLSTLNSYTGMDVRSRSSSTIILGDGYTTLTINGSGFGSTSGSFSGFILQNENVTWRISSSIQWSYNQSIEDIEITGGSISSISYTSQEVSLSVTGSFPVNYDGSYTYRFTGETISYTNENGKRMSLNLQGNYSVSYNVNTGLYSYSGNMTGLTISQNQTNVLSITGSIPITDEMLNTNDIAAIIPLMLTGDDQLTGTSSGSDEFYGWAGKDTLNGGQGEDTLNGGDGNDSLAGGSGNDYLDGGTGNDTINCGSGNDTVLSGSGSDVIYGGEGEDCIELCDEPPTYVFGSDVIDGGEGEDTLQLYGEASNYVFSRPTGSSVRIAYANDSKSYITVSNVEIVGFGSGNQRVYRRLNVQDLLANTSSSFNDGFAGGEEDDDFDGLAGDDVIDGGSGHDHLSGGLGTDSLGGGDGNDTLDGGAGNDTLAGGAGDDYYCLNSINDLVTENADEGTDTIEVGFATSLTGKYSNIENVVLTSSSALNATGNGLANSLTGNSAANTLDGGEGGDTLTGGLGGDTYVVDNDGDTILETSSLANELDTVRSSIAWLLGDNLENLTLTGSDPISGTGNTLANTLVGNSGNNILDGLAGVDSLQGGQGNDLYRVDLIRTGSGAAALVKLQDTITESANGGDDTLEIRVANDFSLTSPFTLTLDTNLENVTLANTGTLKINLTGNSGANNLVGNEGDNTLDGGSGIDTFDGGVGNDTYIVDTEAELTKITEDTGDNSDTLKISYNNTSAATAQTVSLAGSLANLENIFVSGNGLFNLAGNGENNSLTGNAANNRLDGGMGGDTLNGGAGDDKYVVDDANDTLIDSAGNDTVESTISYILSAGLENLTLLGEDALDGTGNGLANTLTGNAGNNILTGGNGNDIYMVQNEFDSVVEAGSLAVGGNDLVIASIGFTLAANVENLTLSGTTNINGTGNTLANILLGNAGNNRLDGGSGADQLTGGGGDDIYVVDGVKDVVTEAVNGGSDTVESNFSYTLTNNLENVLLYGSGNINATGNGVANLLTGNSGNNALDGLIGADTMAGGDGDDVYIVDNNGDVIQEEEGKGTDSVKIGLSAATTYTLWDNVENAIVTSTVAIHLTGNGLNNSLLGNAAANTLLGGDGNDTLNGGAGNDVMKGGAGDDTYLVDSTGDAITEAEDAGSDTVQIKLTSGLYTLTGSLENATVLGTASVNLTGSSTANALTGNSAANTLDGGAGADTLTGGLGSDTYVVDNDGDTILETSSLTNELDTVRSNIAWLLGDNLENLTLTGSDPISGTGNTLANTLAGNSGNNTLDGLAGVDSLQGGQGNDLYRVDLVRTGSGSAAVVKLQDTITESANGGEDTLEIRVANDFTLTSPFTLTLDANLENVTLVNTRTLRINLTGNSGSNILIGNEGDNSLDGGGGLDTCYGGKGNDIYFADLAGELANINESADEGTDTLKIFYNTTDSKGVNISLDGNLANMENVTVLGTGLFNIFGNELANYLTGNAANNALNGGAGNDVLDGLAGSDTMTGGTGDDIFVVFNTGDVVTENLDEGTDTVRSSITYTLAANVENLILTGTSTINGSGNDLNNTLTGNSGANTLAGGLGNDVLIGGGGSDIFTGGNGEDEFVIDQKTKLVATITDFTIDDDTIGLSRTLFSDLFQDGQLKDGVFTSGTSNTFSSSFQLLYNTTTGGLWYDRDGKAGSSAAAQIATLSNKVALTGVMFVLAG